MPVKETTTLEIVPLKSVKGKKAAQERVTLFSIDGKEYSISTKIRPNVSLKVMNVFRKQGDTAGVDFMLETVLGSDAYEALMDFDDLEEDELEKIIKIAFELVAGTTENPKD